VFVYRLGRWILNPERRVRFPYALPISHAYISNHFYADERGGAGADAQGTAIADPRRISWTAPKGARHGIGRVRQAGDGWTHPAPFSRGRLSRLFRTARTGRARPSDFKPAYPEGFSVPFRPQNRRGRNASEKSQVLGIDRIGENLRKSVDFERNKISPSVFEFKLADGILVL
jgi:hypothetical protein